MKLVCDDCCVRSTLLHEGYVEIMEGMDGALKPYVREQDPGLGEIAKILEMGHHQLACIDRSGGVYTDLKCATKYGMDFWRYISVISTTLYRSPRVRPLTPVPIPSPVCRTGSSPALQNRTWSLI